MQSPTATTTTAAAEQRLHITTDHLTNVTINTSQEPWLHAYLSQSTHPIKGRQLVASHPIAKGELLLIDTPYAVIPVVDDPASSPDVLCSNSKCNRKIISASASASTEPRTRTSCPSNCVPDVAWCNEACRAADQARHGFECTWLKKYAASIRSKWGEYDFGMLWLIVRILATRSVEEVGSLESTQRFKAGWSAIESLCGSPETWAHSQVREWSTLVKKYMRTSESLPHGMSADDVLALICREEANSFGLYPRETGILSLSDTSLDRGEQFAAAVYPRAAIANHSCSPNIIHKPDNNGRMVFVSSRDIQAGEECCISYFDLTEFVELSARREHLQKSFRFLCKCERCLGEETPEEDNSWDAFPAMDDDE
ncbi:putative set and mynd domain-containing protein [Aspergillus steynii IBT 23096]|uniref:Putative set and mynd domain-containing protein n=1 Tax=Aspergillus steynii IBT 23096 TaxID=1392250 RepID=A0A2I2G0V8_9EURO|nr:putative set and mynd domain-containing protein [Aspergillus steynii IBT 23096]PLB46512.1 putative set and mynd domain-containing protein [Aspergillus steynii IBT 23096]